MNKKSKPRFLCLFLCIIFLVAHFNAITASAAPLGSKDSQKVINAIQATEQGNAKKLYSNLTGGNTIYIRSFQITNLDVPKTGCLLDDTATVVADNGVTWDIPVIWVNKDGDIIHIAIEIDTIVRSYPIFVFYMPEGYSLLFGENAAYNIGMPDFVASLMKQNGITALSIPEAGRTYISAFLPNTDKFKLNIVPPEPDYPENVVSKEYDPSPAAPSGGSSSSGSRFTPPTDNDTTPPDPGLTEEEKKEVTDAHCSQGAIDLLGVDKLAALVTWVKYTLEPEATNLLASKFPAYKNAAANNELGNSIGLYIYYDDSDSAMAAVETQSTNSADVRYRVSVNAAYFYEYDSTAQDYVFDGTTNYSDLDNTLVHELMHAYMEDYCRTGMEGIQYNETTSDYTSYIPGEQIDFPRWFVEGTASSVDNTYQFRNGTIKRYYGYDSDPNSNTYNTYVADDLKTSYSSAASDINITGSSTPSNYITGYLATIYLSYLAAKANGKEAISGDRVDSSVILFGENYILESLHSGKTLDEVISTVSNSMYPTTEEFEKDFILDASGKDGGQSLEFCTKLLNYLQQCSSDDATANGSILLDFADTNTAQLHKSLLNQTQTVYIPSDSKDYVVSSVDKNDALHSGGTTVVGTTSKAEDDPNQSIGKEILVAKETEPDVLGESRDNDFVTDSAFIKSTEKDITPIPDEDNIYPTGDEQGLDEDILCQPDNNSNSKEVDPSSYESNVNSIADAISLALSYDSAAEDGKETNDNNAISETNIESSSNNIDESCSNNSQSSTQEETKATIVQADSSTSSSNANSEESAVSTDPQTEPTTTNDSSELQQAEDTITNEESSSSSASTTPNDLEALNSSESTTSTTESEIDESGSAASNESGTPVTDDSDSNTEPVVEVSITEEPAEQVSNPIIISESDNEEDSSNTDDSSSDQILDAIIEESSNDEEEFNKELLTK